MHTFALSIVENEASNENWNKQRKNMLKKMCIIHKLHVLDDFPFIVAHIMRYKPASSVNETWSFSFPSLFLANGKSDGYKERITGEQKLT